MNSLADARRKITEGKIPDGIQILRSVQHRAKSVPKKDAIEALIQVIETPEASESLIRNEMAIFSMKYPM